MKKQWIQNLRSFSLSFTTSAIGRNSSLFVSQNSRKTNYFLLLLFWRSTNKQHQKYFFSKKIQKRYFSPLEKHIQMHPFMYVNDNGPIVKFYERIYNEQGNLSNRHYMQVSIEQTDYLNLEIGIKRQQKLNISFSPKFLQASEVAPIDK